MTDFFGMGLGEGANFNGGQQSSGNSNVPIKSLDSPPMKSSSPTAQLFTNNMAGNMPQLYWQNQQTDLNFAA